MNSYIPNSQLEYNAIQMILPMDIGIKLDSSDPIHTFLKVMEGVNLRKYVIRTSSKGRKGYDSIKMLKIILFAYMNQIYSLRSIEHACKTDIRFMYLAQEECPSHQAIGNFIKNQLRESIHDIFVEINKRLFELDGITLDAFYLDGTNYEANANKFSFVWKKAALKTQARKIEEVNTILSNLKDLFQENHIKVTSISSSADLDSYLTNYERILKESRIELVYGRGKRKTPLQRSYDKLTEIRNKLTECETKIEICGEDRNSYSKSDYDATFMHMKYDYYCNTGIFKPGYNFQVGVSDEYISEVYISNARTDTKTLIPTLERFREDYSIFPNDIVADAGYGSYSNYMFCLENRINTYVKYNTWQKEISGKLKPYDAIHFKYQPNYFICPNGNKMEFIKETYSDDSGYLKIMNHYRCPTCNRCPSKQECTKSEYGRTIKFNPILNEFKSNARKLLESEKGIEYRKRRSIYAEGVFGILKQDFEFNRLRRRGMKNVETELTLVSIGFNLSKYHNKLNRNKVMN